VPGARPADQHGLTAQTSCGAAHSAECGAPSSAGPTSRAISGRRASRPKRRTARTHTAASRLDSVRGHGRSPSAASCRARARRRLKGPCWPCMVRCFAFRIRSFSVKGKHRCGDGQVKNQLRGGAPASARARRSAPPLGATRPRAAALRARQAQARRCRRRACARARASACRRRRRRPIRSPTRRSHRPSARRAPAAAVAHACAAVSTGSVCSAAHHITGFARPPGSDSNVMLAQSGWFSPGWSEKPFSQAPAQEAPGCKTSPANI